MKTYMQRMRIWPHNPSGENWAFKAQVIRPVGEHRRMSGKCHLPWHWFPVSDSGQVQTSTITVTKAWILFCLNQNPRDQRGLSVHLTAPAPQDSLTVQEKLWRLISNIPTVYSLIPWGWGALGSQVTYEENCEIWLHFPQGGERLLN